MAKSILKKSIILLAVLLLQFGLVQRLKLGPYSANLCVMALICICFFNSPAHAAAYGGVYGLFVDGASGRGFGINLLLYMYLAVSIKLIASEKINNSPAIMAAHVGLFTFIYYLAYGLLSLTVPRGDIAPARWLLTALVTASINAVISLPVLYLVYRRKKGGGPA